MEEKIPARIIIGEVGNELGHRQPWRKYKSCESLEAAAKHLCTVTYVGDGWYKTELRADDQF